MYSIQSRLNIQEIAMPASALPAAAAPVVAPEAEVVSLLLRLSPQSEIDGS